VIIRAFEPLIRITAMLPDPREVANAIIVLEKSGVLFIKKAPEGALYSI
jgi:hypothetical protein